MVVIENPGFSISKSLKAIKEDPEIVSASEIRHQGCKTVGKKAVVHHGDLGVMIRIAGVSSKGDVQVENGIVIPRPLIYNFRRDQ